MFTAYGGIFLTSPDVVGYSDYSYLQGLTLVHEVSKIINSMLGLSLFSPMYKLTIIQLHKYVPDLSSLKVGHALGLQHPWGQGSSGCSDECWEENDASGSSSTYISNGWNTGDLIPGFKHP